MDMKKPFIHELPDAKDLFESISFEKAESEDKEILPIIIEKDYWLMHCLWGLQQQGYQFELKGGTSLSRGYNLIDRFSEDIDIQIHPTDELPVGKNQDKASHVKARERFFDQLAAGLDVPGLEFKRDSTFDDKKLRGAGIRGEYTSFFEANLAYDQTDNLLKPGVLLEVGFDKTNPNTACDITSWAYDRVNELGLDVIDNRAFKVPCYNLEYTFVEKLQTISTKYRQYIEDKEFPINFLRHYYDVYKLLGSKRVLDFIGTDDYIEHKILRFRSADEKNIKKNDAFIISDSKVRGLFSKEFEKKSAMYFGGQPQFNEILERIAEHVDEM